MHINDKMWSGVFFFLLLLLSWLGLWAVAYRSKRRKAKEVEKKKAAEQAYLDALPSLDTEWLMKVPSLHRFGNSSNNPKRCYGARYSRLIVYDNRGEAWVGLVIPEVLKSLRDSEYSRGDYWVPFRGAGEAVEGKAVSIIGLQIWCYPDWMQAGINVQDWDCWVNIERKFRSSWLSGNYQDAMKNI
ncbi:MAG: hypothetical protein NTV02_01760 [Candidatus Zambryskibacteria bacterium]|nr:hypothetical protein [Candidatus Zambryskibacteria bacterium]